MAGVVDSGEARPGPARPGAVDADWPRNMNWPVLSNVAEEGAGELVNWLTRMNRINHC